MWRKRRGGEEEENEEGSERTRRGVKDRGITLNILMLLLAGL